MELSFGHKKLCQLQIPPGKITKVLCSLLILSFLTPSRNSFPLFREAIRREREREMATEKADVEVSDTNNDGIQNTSTQTSVNSETPTSAVPRFGKALAHRALYGSSSRHGGSRKARSSDVKTLPSRLSKVSLADDTENRE
ncbi:hypothetical protein Peur_048477 [Populus x canadensis]